MLSLSSASVYLEPEIAMFVRPTRRQSRPFEIPCKIDTRPARNNNITRSPLGRRIRALNISSVLSQDVITYRVVIEICVFSYAPPPPNHDFADVRTPSASRTLRTRARPTGRRGFSPFFIFSRERSFTRDPFVVASACENARRTTECGAADRGKRRLDRTDRPKLTGVFRRNRKSFFHTVVGVSKTPNESFCSRRVVMTRPH